LKCYTFDEYVIPTYIIKENKLTSSIDHYQHLSTLFFFLVKPTVTNYIAMVFTMSGHNCTCVCACT